MIAKISPFPQNLLTIKLHEICRFFAVKVITRQNMFKANFKNHWIIS